VLFYQEDPNLPIPPERPGMTIFQTGRYQSYLDFRSAEATFVYETLHGIGFHLLPGVPRQCSVDPAKVAEQVAKLEKNLEPVKRRFGEEYAVAQIAQSREGLLNRQKRGEVQAFQEQWDDVWWTAFVWADRLDLVRVYKADWFAMLWVVLFFGVLSNTFRGGWRRLLKPRKWGFLMTHTGVMLVILAGFWGRLAEMRGMMELHVGETKDRFQEYSGAIRPLVDPGFFGLHRGQPFALRLDAFRADYRDVLEVFYAKQTAQGLEQEFPLQPPKLQIYEGKKIAYDYDDQGRATLRMEVLRYVPQATVRPSLRPAEAGERGTPEILYTIVGPGGGHRSGRLVDRAGSPLVHAPSGLHARLRRVENEEGARQALRASVSLDYGSLHLDQGDGEVASPGWSVVPGARFQVDANGRSYQVEVVKAVPNLSLSRQANGSWKEDSPSHAPEFQEPNNPAVLLRIHSPAGEEEMRWVSEQEFHGPTRRFSDLRFHFHWDGWASPAAARLYILISPDGQLWSGRAGQPDSLAPLTLGKALPLPHGYSLTVDQAEANGVAEQNIVPLAGADFFDSSPAAIQLRIETPEGTMEPVLSAAGSGDWKTFHYTGPDGGDRIVALNFHTDKQDLPKEWRSKLTILHQDGQGGWKDAQTGEIRVNDYLYYDGFRFFQTNANPADPTYSEIGVVFDPGIDTVLLGFYMIALGTIVVFLLNPLLTKRHPHA